MSLEMKYFVLKPRAKSGIVDYHAKASRFALLTYAKMIEAIDPELASDLEIWVWEEEDRLAEGGGS